MTTGAEALYSLQMRRSCRQNGQLMAQICQLAAFLPGNQGMHNVGIARRIQTTRESIDSGSNLHSSAWTARTGRYLAWFEHHNFPILPDRH
jgi:hypothetical protein